MGRLEYQDLSVKHVKCEMPVRHHGWRCGVGTYKHRSRVEGTSDLEVYLRVISVQIAFKGESTGRKEQGSLV